MRALETDHCPACPPIAASTAQEFTVTAWISARRRAGVGAVSERQPAREAGRHGWQCVSLRVSQSGLTATATDFATTGDMSAGASEFSGDQFNFGAINLEPEGTGADCRAAHPVWR